MTIRVLGGVNGAGKSSIGGSNIRANNGQWYNPDEQARQRSACHPERNKADIVGEVWAEGYRRLQVAVRDNIDFTFETTLGVNSITRTLLEAIAANVPVKIWYCGLTSPELHIQRVAERVAKGGHDIPEHKIRERCATSMHNLCSLAPGLTELDVHDNSRPLDADHRPSLQRLLHVRGSQIRTLHPDMPEWAKPVAAICPQHFSR